MGITVTRTGTFPTRAWDRQAMAMLADGARSVMVTRTFYDGRGEDGTPLAPYSTRPMTVSYKSPTARRLKPKGGEPAYGRGHPRRLIRNGRAPAGRGWVVVGRYYEGGYAQYKQDSRKGPRNAEVDLTLSGTLLRSIRVKRVGETSATIGATGAALAYAGAVDARRPFFGLSAEDREALDLVFSEAMAAAAERSARGTR